MSPTIARHQVVTRPQANVKNALFIILRDGSHETACIPCAGEAIRHRAANREVVEADWVLLRTGECCVCFRDFTATRGDA